MEQKDKELLLQDLCARLPYGVKVKGYSGKTDTLTLGNCDLVSMFYKDEDNWYCKPYLRPMSSMSEEEKRELQSFFPGSFGNQYLDLDKETIELYECNSTMEIDLYDSVQIVDFCKKNHLDCYGLIKKGLALSTDEYNPYND